MLTKVLTGKLTFTSLKPCDLSNCTKEQIKAYFENSYDLNESIFTGLKDDSVFYKCPDRLRLPLIFYYCHTACVYINKFILAGLLKPEQRVNYDFETMFETGVDEMSWDDTENYRIGGKFRWPSVDSVVDYRRQVRALVLSVIEETPLHLPVTMDSPWWGIFMCMEHERIHLETSSVLIRQLPIEMVTKPRGWKYARTARSGSNPKNEMIRVSATKVKLGKPEKFPSFGWDNEYGQLEIQVPAFEASRYLVSNRDFLDFILDNGYLKKQYWTDEGWHWVNYRKARHPKFWTCNKIACIAGCGADLASYSHCKADQHISNGQNSYCNGHNQVDGNGHQGKDEGGGSDSTTVYKFRCMFNEVDMPWDWPVETNYHEAKAFAMWKGPDYRLLCEAENNAIRCHTNNFNEGTKCDIIYDDKIEANLNMQYGSSTPVDMYPANELGFYDTMGNVWRWVEDHFNGYPGFQTSYLYDDFSGATFDGSHNMILGGSWVSTGDEASRFARYAFRRHFFQHAGFRLAKTIFSKPKERAILPARFMKTLIYIEGYGVKENPLTLDTSKMSYIPMESTYLHYLYDTEDICKDMLQFEYGHTDSFSACLAQRATELVKKYGVSSQRMLHMGCGTGRTTFELSKEFKQILAVDVVGRFIDACIQLQSGNSLEYSTFNGFKKDKKEVTLNNGTIPVNSINFKRLGWLPNEVEFFDFILATNFDRLLNVKSWTVRFPEILRQNGLLMVASGGQWNEAELETLLGKKFDLVETDDVHFNKSGTPVCLTVWRHKADATFIPLRDAGDCANGKA